MAVKIEGLSKAFDDKKVLDKLDMELPDKGLVALLGNSGSGKTTLLRIIAGLERADEGYIKGIEGKKISYMFQNDRLLKGFSALENVALVTDKAKAELWLERFGLKNSLHKKPGQLSGGMCRRVSLARAMAFTEDGGILLLDEPFKGFDAGIKSQIIPYITNYVQKGLVILVTHNEKEASLADLRFFIDEI